MADVVTRFRLETTQYDSQLRNESQRLAEFSKTARAAGNEFGKFTAKEAEAAKAFGNIAVSATNSKDKVKELVGAYNAMANAYNALTKEQQQSDFAKNMVASLEVLKVRIGEAKQELYSLGNAAKQVKQSAGGFDASQLVGGIAGQFGMSASMFTGVGAAIAGAGAAFKAVQDNVRTAMGFERSMSQLSALTGMVGKDLDRLKEYSIELGSTTTLTASQVADAFRLIGSQQPQLLSSGEALKDVTKYAIRLSEAAGIDLSTASQTLSTSINQMGGDSNNAARYVNVLAAASQKGAGDISWLGEAIVKSGTYAKAIGTSYEELTANLETLAKAGYDASTAGTALRSIILQLEKQADTELKPSVVGLTQAFENLGAKQLDISGYAAIVNGRFAAQAMTLANNAQQTREMTEAITGTNIAEQQASTNVNNLSGAIKQLESAWEGLNLHINDSNGPITTFVNDLTTTIRQIDVLAQKFMDLKQKIEENPLFAGIGVLMKRNMQTVINQLPFIGPAMTAKGLLDDVVGDPNKNEESNFNQAKFKNVLQSMSPQTSTFDNRIQYQNPLASLIDDANESIDKIKQLQGEIKALKKLRDEASNKGNTELRDQYNNQIKAKENEIKQLRGTGGSGGGSGQSKESRAASIVEQAQESYAQTMTEASLRMQAGLDDTVAYKKKELQAQEQLFSAYGKAYATYADPKYKAAYDEAAVAYTRLAEEVKAETEAATKQKEAAKALEAAQKKLADAQEKLDIANASGNLKDIRSAQKAYNTAQADVEKLGGLTGSNGEVPVKIRLTTDNLSAYVSELKSQLTQVDLGTDAYTKLNEQLIDATTMKTMMQVAIQEGLNDLVIDMAPVWENILNKDNIPDGVWQELGQKLQEELSASGSSKRYGINKRTGEVAEAKGATKNQTEQFAKGMSTMTGAVSSIAGGIENLGVELPEGLNRAIGVMQGISTILTAILTITTLINTKEDVQAITSFIPGLKNGGIIPHAANGMLIPGNDYSDRTPIFASSGELILNRAMQHNIAGQLEGANSRMGGGGTPYVNGEQIWLGVNNYLRRSGRGEIVTAKR